MNQGNELKKNKKIIINDTLVYQPEEHRLIPLGVRGKEIVLNVPASRCLQLLLKQPGITVSQSEFFSEVWEKNGQLVTANTLYQNISLLRKGLREAGLVKNVLRTVPKVGVVFSGAAEILEEDSADELEEQTEDQPQPTSQFEPAAVPVPDSADSAFLSQKKMPRYGLFTAFVVMMAILLTSNASPSTQFFNTHNKVADINHCSVYIDRNDLATHVAGYKQFLTSNNVVCHPDEFVYITRIPADQSTLVLFCDTSAAGDLRCSTRFKIDNKHDPLADLQPAGNH